ncbi:MAG: cyclic nucleotide-binding domain-containing protein, partial [Pseudomonadota bacterium]|nr:cyclic nucleotide-binding domain-containing protein [Pseudomonadota bacterium]
MPYDTINPTLQTRQFNCAACPANGSCIVGESAGAELAAWSCAVEGQTSLAQAGKSLLTAGSKVEAIYSVRAGCLKSFTVDEDGNERVRAFYLPGDLIGLDALGSETHPAHVVA